SGLKETGYGKAESGSTTRRIAKKTTIPKATPATNGWRVSDGAREATPKNMLAHRKDNAKCRASPRNATGTPPVKASAPSKPLATICSRRTGATPLYAAKEIAKMMSSAPATEPPRSTADAYDRFKMPCFKRHAAGEAAVHWPWRGDEWARA